MDKQAAEAAATAVAAAVGTSEGAMPKGELLKVGGDGAAPPVDANNDKGDLTWACPECGRAFQSQRAMYGHLKAHPNRARTRKRGRVPPLPPTEDAGSSADPEEKDVLTILLQLASQGPSPEAEEPAQVGEQPHQCLRCGKVFRTGQALGGHMRKHWLEDQAAAAAPAVPPAAPAAASNGASQNFDLNELPSP